jgi:hemoglobin
MERAEARNLDFDLPDWHIQREGHCDEFRESVIERDTGWRHTMAPNASKDSLYSRLGGYDAIAAVADDLLPRLRNDPRLQRFWSSPRSIDTNNRERQLLVDFIAASASGPNYYLGRDMKTSHKGMGIEPADYAALKGHLTATLEKFSVPQRERDEVMVFIASLETDIVEP